MMENLKQDLDNLNKAISKLEIQIEEAKIEAERNIEPLENELAKVRRDKRDYGAKSDFESVQQCRSRENNLKFRIDAQWNRYFMLKNDLTKLKHDKNDIESRIKLEEDKIRRKDEILSRMDTVLENYRKTGDLKQAAVESKIQPGSVEQWREWGKNGFNDTYSYFYEKVREIDDYFKVMESERLKMQMDSVAEAYGKTGSLEKASEIAGVSYDTVQYWYEWGSRGFGAENTYFFKKIDELKH